MKENFEEDKEKKEAKAEPAWYEKRADGIIFHTFCSAFGLVGQIVQLDNHRIQPLPVFAGFLKSIL